MSSCLCPACKCNGIRYEICFPEEIQALLDCDDYRFTPKCILQCSTEEVHENFINLNPERITVKITLNNDEYIYENKNEWQCTQNNTLQLKRIDNTDEYIEFPEEVIAKPVKCYDNIIIIFLHYDDMPLSLEDMEFSPLSCPVTSLDLDPLKIDPFDWEDLISNIDSNIQIGVLCDSNIVGNGNAYAIDDDSVVPEPIDLPNIIINNAVRLTHQHDHRLYQLFSKVHSKYVEPEEDFILNNFDGNELFPSLDDTSNLRFYSPQQVLDYFLELENLAGIQADLLIIAISGTEITKNSHIFSGLHILPVKGCASFNNIGQRKSVNSVGSISAQCQFPQACGNGSDLHIAVSYGAVGFEPIYGEGCDTIGFTGNIAYLPSENYIGKLEELICNLNRCIDLNIEEWSSPSCAGFCAVAPVDAVACNGIYVGNNFGWLDFCTSISKSYGCICPKYNNGLIISIDEPSDCIAKSLSGSYILNPLARRDAFSCDFHYFGGGYIHQITFLGENLDTFKIYNQRGEFITYEGNSPENISGSSSIYTLVGSKFSFCDIPEELEVVVL